MSSISDWQLIVRYIDINHNNKIDSQSEVQKAKELGIKAEEGESIEKVIEKSSKITLQDALAQIDKNQTVDNKQQQDENDPLKKKKFSAIG